MTSGVLRRTAGRPHPRAHFCTKSSKRLERGGTSRRLRAVTIGPVRYIGARISDQLFDRVKAAAEAERRTMNTWLTIAIERYLEEGEKDRKRTTKRTT